MPGVAVQVKLLDEQASTGASRWLEVGQLDRLTVHVSGMVLGDTVQVEVSNEFPDGPSAIENALEITEDGVYAIDPGAFKLRVNFDDNSGGGTINCWFFGYGY